MTTYTFTKGFYPNVLTISQWGVVGTKARALSFSSGGDSILGVKGAVRAHASDALSLTFPITSVLTLTGRVKGTVAPATLFSEFAHYTAAATVDPVVSLVKGKVSGVAAYDNTQPSSFRRVSLSLTLPNDTSTTRRAAYLAPGVRIAGLAQNNGVNIDGAQVELALGGVTTPGNYEPARAIQVGVRPNRLNLGWSKGTSGWGVVAPTGGALGAATVQSSGAFDDNGAFIRTTCTTAGTSTGGGLAFGAPNADTIPVTAGVPYSFRTVLRTNRTGASLQYLVRWYNASSAQVGDNSAILVKPVAANAWTEFKLEGLTPPAGATRAYITVYLTAGIWAVNDTLDASGMLIERAAKVGTYFDGGFGADYLWEAGGTVGASRSYYYEDYAVRAYLLRQVLAENCPLGTIPGVPQFAVLPRF